MSQITPLLLAAGSSRRMGARNKLLCPIAPGAPPMIVQSLTNLLEAGLEPLIVLGHQAEAVAAAIAHLPGRRVKAAHHEAGMSTSLAAGIKALAADCAAAMICLADMPLIEPQTFKTLLGAYEANHHPGILVPTHQGKRGHPVFFARRHFAALASLTGDEGGKAVLAANAAELSLAEINDPAILKDFDEPSAFGL